MKIIPSNTQEVWDDPVWSKVIAGIILSFLSFIGFTLYSIVASLLKSLPLRNVVIDTIRVLNSGVEIKVSYILLIVIFFLSFISNQIIYFIRGIYNKYKSLTTVSDDINDQELPPGPIHSPSFFDLRMARSFPGDSDIVWYDKPREAIHRLDLLLKQPLIFHYRDKNSKSRPIWWFRGGESMHIEIFRRISIFTSIVLIDYNRLKIKRIAAFKSNTYWKQFVYVEAEGENQTGLYNYSDEYINQRMKESGYFDEEYSLLKNRLGWNIPISREDYDDGATVIRGKVRDCSKSKFRVRYLTDYNFIIAAKGSPFNSSRFSRESKRIFDRILSGDTEPEELFNFMKGFNREEGNLH